MLTGSVALEVHNRKDKRQQSQAAAKENLTGYGASFYKCLDVGKGHLVKLQNPSPREF